MQNNAARIVLQAARRCHAQPLLRELHWLPIQHRIKCKVVVLTFKSRSNTTAPTYLSRHIKAAVTERTLRLSAVPLPDKPFTRTDFARRAYRCSVPTVWNSLPVIASGNSIHNSWYICNLSVLQQSASLLCPELTDFGAGSRRPCTVWGEEWEWSCRVARLTVYNRHNSFSTHPHPQHGLYV